MLTERRDFIHGLLSLYFGFTASSSYAINSRFANKPLGIILPAQFSSKVIRLIAELLGKNYSPEGYILESKIGASGLIATRYLLEQSEFDKKVMLVTPTTSSLNFLLRDELGNNPLDILQPLGLIYENNSILVSSKDNIRNFDDLVRLAKQKSGRLTIGTHGVGSLYHVTSMLMAELFQFEFTHVPYGSGSPLVPILNGEVDIGFMSAPIALNWKAANKIYLLASTSRARAQAFADIPTTVELHPKFIVSDNFGLVAKKGLSPDFYKAINQTLIAVMNFPEVVSQLAEYGYLKPPSHTMNYHSQRMIDDLKLWSGIVKKIRGTTKIPN